MKYKNPFNYIHLALIFLFGLITLYPTFKFSLTGDDFLGLWRFQQFDIKGVSGYLKYFFTDYGPQDLLTNIIHIIFGFKPFYYYLIAFIFRVIAALSFLPLLYLLTKNKFASFLGALFFLISYTGSEVLDWSFNMPSYIAITFMNLFLTIFIRYLNNSSNRLLYASIMLYFLSISTQPLRMMVLPFIVITFYLSLVFIFKDGINIRKTFVSQFIYIFIFLVFILATSIGITTGLKTDTEKEGTGKIFNNLISNINQSTKTKGYGVLLYPVAQVGNILIPTTYIPNKYDVLDKQESITLVLLSVSVYILAFYLLNKYIKFKSKTISWIIYSSGILWGSVIWILFLKNDPVLISTSNLLGLFTGGFFIIFTILIIYLFRKKYYAVYGLLLSTIIILLSFIPPWVRNPDQIHSSNSRYLIVSAAGISLLFGVLLNLLIKKNKSLAIPLIIFFTIHLYATNKYISHLSLVKDSLKTESIRSSLVTPKNNNSKEPLVYYFEADNPEVLYHAIMFGFPMFIHYYYDFDSPWNVAYTENWIEVVNSYLDGSGLTRFGTINIEPVKLENIYSFKLEYGILHNTTESTRQKLIEIKTPLNNN